MLSALILSGGESSRMGTDKALLKVGEKVLIEKIVNIAMRVAPQVYVLSPWPERYQSVLPSSCQLLLEVKSNDLSHGPLIAFAQALPQIESEWILLLACDLPNLSSEVLRHGYSSLPTKAMVYLAESDFGWEPLCGFYRKTCYESLLNYLQTGGKSFQGWLNSITVEKWKITDRSILFNCNSPDDLHGIVKF